MELGGPEGTSAGRGWLTRFFSKERTAEQPYTEFLSSLERNVEPESRQQLDAVLKELRTLLSIEIRRRGLSGASPSVLGLVGYQYWQRVGSVSFPGGGEGDALEELTVDCYVYIFIDRLRSLLAQLKVRGNIDGLVRRNVRNFVHDTQKRHDPMGFRIFQVFRRVVKECVDEGDLFIDGDSQRLHNDTFLSFNQKRDLSEEVDHAIDWGPVVARWNDALLSEMVTARGAKLADVVAKFKHNLLAIESQGIRSFRCRDIIEPLKADARSRWANLWSHGDGSTLVDDETRDACCGGTPVGASLDARERFTGLVDCVEHKLRRFEGQERTRKHLLKLWDYLKRFAASELDGEHREMSWEAMEDTFPSRRELATRLEIPRDRFPDLYKRIRRAAKGCLDTPLASPVERDVSQSAPDSVRRSVMKDRRDELLQETGEAYGRLQEDPEAGLTGASMRSGRLYALAESSELGVEWLALESREDGCWHMIPADPHPWLGSRDWPLQGEGLGPLTLRCAEDHWLDAKVFAAAVETAAVETAQLNAVAVHLGDLATAVANAEDEQLEVDEDPEYRAWCQQLQDIGTSLACHRMDNPSTDSHLEVSERRGASPRGVRSRGLGDGFLARAALIFLTVGMAHWSGRWIGDQRSSDQLGSLEVQKRNLVQQLSEIRDEKNGLVEDLRQLATQSMGGSHTWTLIDPGRVRSEPAEVLLSESAAWLALLMELPPLEPEDVMEIVPVGGDDSVWQDSAIGVNDDEERNLVLVASQVLAEGDYTLRILRSTEGKSVQVFSRDLRVVRQ